MRKLPIALVAALLIALPADLAMGQGAVQQSGSVTSFHAPAWFQNGVVGDGGTPAAPFLSAVGLYNGANCPLGVSSQTSPGTGTGQYAALTVCQTNTATTFTVNGYGGLAAPTVYFNIGGVSYPFPGSGSGNVVGPNSSTSGHIACFNNSSGTLLSDCSALGTFAGQNYTTPPAIGGVTPAAGAFTTLSASSTVSGTGFSTYLASPPNIGGSAAAAGAFTTLSASSTVSGTGFSTYLASPPDIGTSAAAAGAFTTLSASSTVSGPGFTTYLASPPAIGGSAPSTGAFTTLTASTAVSGTGFTNLFASPPAIGGTAAAAIKGTTVTATTSINIGSSGVLLCSATAPTVTSAGSSPAITDANGTCSFTVNVGTGGTASAIVLGLPTAATGWTCGGSDITTQSTSVFLQKQTASTVSSATIVNYNTAGAATAFVASDHVRLSCRAD